MSVCVSGVHMCAHACMHHVSCMFVDVYLHACDYALLCVTLNIDCNFLINKSR